MYGKKKVIIIKNPFYYVAFISIFFLISIFSKPNYYKITYLNFLDKKIIPSIQFIYEKEIHLKNSNILKTYEFDKKYISNLKKEINSFLNKKKILINDKLLKKYKFEKLQIQTSINHLNHIHIHILYINNKSINNSYINSFIKDEIKKLEIDLKNLVNDKMKNIFQQRYLINSEKAILKFSGNSLLGLKNYNENIGSESIKKIFIIFNFFILVLSIISLLNYINIKFKNNVLSKL